MTGFNDMTGDVIRRLGGAMDRAATRIGMEVTAEYKRNLRSKLNVHGQAKGDLLNSASYFVDGTKVTIGNVKVYGRIHEFGGVISAKNGPYLVFKTADGQWHSVPTVTIPARPTLRPAIMDKPGRPGEILAEELRRA